MGWKHTEIEIRNQQPEGNKRNILESEILATSLDDREGVTQTPADRTKSVKTKRD